MAVGDQIAGIVGTGTISDPYKPTTFGEFLSCVVISNAYVCLENDIDVSKDNIYKTGIDYSIYMGDGSGTTYIYGTAMTYNSSTTYNKDDKCTWNDGEHGLCTYTCKVDGTVGIDVSDSTHWTRGGSPIKKITGLISRGPDGVFNYKIPDTTFSNIFFESLVFFGSNNALFRCQYNNRTLTLNDCILSCFYKQSQNYAPQIIAGRAILNRCSLYIKFSGPDLSSLQSNTFKLYYNSSGLPTLNNCTCDYENVSLMGCNGIPSDNAFGIMHNCSIRCVCNIYTFSSYIRLVIGDADSYGNFFALTANYVEDADSGVFCYGTGVNIADSEAIGEFSYISNNPGYGYASTVFGTTAQCKDKDWLISQGFFAS